MRQTVLLVLVGIVTAAAAPARGEWLTNYAAAHRQATAEMKPLLVVLGRPAADRTSDVRATPIHDRSDRDLLSHYKLCRIDVSTPYGRKIAEAFQADEFPFTAIIDNTASVQLYRKGGRFSTVEWVSVLETYKTGNRPLARTARTTAYRVSADCFT